MNTNRLAINDRMYEIMRIAKSKKHRAMKVER